MENWKEIAADLKFNRGFSWTQVYAALPDIKPESIRGALRRTEMYKENVEQKSDKLTTILSIGDFHYPFHRKSIVDDLRPFAGKIDILVIPGDEQDCQSISKFSKMYRESFWEELTGARKLLIDVAELIKPKKIVVTESNHTKRLGNYLCRRLDDDLLPLMPTTSTELLIETGFDIRDHKAKSRRHYDPLNAFLPIEFTHSFDVKIGKAVFCHPDVYGSPIMKTADILQRNFLDQYRDIDTIVVAHTHHLGFYPIGGVALYENGCACEPCSYAPGTARRPWEAGFIVFKQDADGNTLHNQTQLIMLDRK